MAGKYTYCNIFTRAVAGWFGWTDWETEDRDQAGEITRFMMTDPRFKQVSYAGAGRLAAQGYLVVAGQINTTKDTVEPNDPTKWRATGHVCVIAPEDRLVRSGKWKKNVPLCANVGRNNWYGKALSWAFRNEPMGLWWYVG